MTKPFKVENVVFKQNDSKMMFVDADGRELVFELEGDCCSHSYFDNDCKLDVGDILGHTIKKIETNCVGDGERDHTVTLIYMTVITTDKGHFTLSWRNDSNGYYSGWLKIYPAGANPYRTDSEAIKSEYDIVTEG